MIHALMGRNVNDIYPRALDYLRINGQPDSSRNGPVLVLPAPMITTYLKPFERVLVAPNRDANPFFHLAEALWMLAGEQNLDPVLTTFLPRMKDFSDDGRTLAGAYGYRWRGYYGRDQIEQAITELQRNPLSRQVVIAIYDGTEDGFRREHGTKDLPCNLTVVLDRRFGGPLNLTLFNRSNDMVWGAYGANIVQFSMLQEYIASRLGVPMGWLVQVSTNFHGYVSTLPGGEAVYADPYATNAVHGTPFFMDTDQLSWHDDLLTFVRAPYTPIETYSSRYFRGVVGPMAVAHQAYKEHNLTEAIEILGRYGRQGDDWRYAGLQWLTRRLNRRRTAP